MSASWVAGWLTGDNVTASEFKKGVGAIYDTTLSAPSGNVDVTGIIASYAHLEVVVYARTDVAETGNFLRLRFNNDSGANYADQRTLSANTTVTATPRDGNTEGIIGLTTGANAPANLFAVTRILILNYAQATNKKAAEATAAYRSGTGATNMATLTAGMFWDNAAAIDRITILPSSGNFVALTRATVYARGA